MELYSKECSGVYFSFQTSTYHGIFLQIAFGGLQNFSDINKEKFHENDLQLKCNDSVVFRIDTYSTP